MKKILLLLALTAPAFAQQATPPATTPPTTATTPAAKPKPLAPPDTKFAKAALDGMYYVMDLAGKTKNSAKAESVKTLGSKLKSDLDKAWADVGGLASERGESVPTKLAGADKQKSERLGK